MTLTSTHTSCASPKPTCAHEVTGRVFGSNYAMTVPCRMIAPEMKEQFELLAQIVQNPKEMRSEMARLSRDHGVHIRL